jgi:hypothetical protein
MSPNAGYAPTPPDRHFGGSERCNRNARPPVTVIGMPYRISSDRKPGATAIKVQVTTRSKPGGPSGFLAQSLGS